GFELIPLAKRRVADRAIPEFAIGIARQPKEELMKKQRTLPVLLATLVAIACAGAAGATDANPGHAKAKHGTTTVQRARGADGLVDKTVTGPKGGVTAVDRSRGADGLIDKTVTGPKGGVTTVDRSRGADGVVDKSVTGPKGGVATVDRSRGADGLVDKTVTGPKGGGTTVERSRNPDGTIDETITKTRPYRSR